MVWILWGLELMYVSPVHIVCRLSQYLITGHFLFTFISGASMNPARSLAPALLSSTLSDLWLYWSATFIGSSFVALFLRRKFV